MHNTLIILAAGLSSRMKRSAAEGALSESDVKQASQRSKALISVGKNNRPLLDYLLYNARSAGYREIIIVKRPDDTLMQEFYGEKMTGNDFHGLQISFADQHIPPDREKPFGTADAIFQAMTQLPHLQQTPFTVCNSDNLYSVTAFRLLRETSSPNAMICYDQSGLDFSPEKISGFALCRLNAGNHLIDIVEKPSVETLNEFAGKYGFIPVSMNIFKLDGKTMFPYFENCPVHPVRNEKELPTAIMNMISEIPNALLGIYLSEHVPDLTAKADIAAVREFLATHYPNDLWESKYGAE
ncbi:MAG: NTP transferase domain-containing protein [Calditrichae bacterium]|nr:NTP transferase domain-containing protein [Calditrichia bacterium]